MVAVSGYVTKIFHFTLAGYPWTCQQGGAVAVGAEEVRNHSLNIISISGSLRTNLDTGQTQVRELGHHKLRPRSNFGPNNLPRGGIPLFLCRPCHRPYRLPSLSSLNPCFQNQSHVVVEDIPHWCNHRDHPHQVRYSRTRSRRKHVVPGSMPPCVRTTPTSLLSSTTGTSG